MTYCLKCEYHSAKDEEMCPVCNTLMVDSMPDSSLRGAPPVLLTTTTGRFETATVVSLLKSIGIPVFYSGRDAGDYVKIILGDSYFGEDIYVPAEFYNIAKEFLSAPMVFSEEENDFFN